MKQLHVYLIMLLCIISGCGNSESQVPRYPVNVEVKMDGKPFDGLISFTPRDAKTGNFGTGGKLIAGKFSATDKFGPTAGGFNVHITVFDSTATNETKPANTDSEETGPQPVIKGYAKKVIDVKPSSNDIKLDINSSELTDQPVSQD